MARTHRTPKPLIPAAPKRRFDLSDHQMAVEAEIPILDPTDLAAKIDTGIRITIRSQYSEEAAEAASAGRAKLTLVDGKVNPDDPALAENFTEQAIAITVGWHEILEAGVPLPFTTANVRRVYTDPRYVWLLKQVQAAYMDTGRFFEKPKSA